MPPMAQLRPACRSHGISYIIYKQAAMQVSSIRPEHMIPVAIIFLLSVISVIAPPI